jgi:predicted transcriptional regulator
MRNHDQKARAGRRAGSESSLGLEPPARPTSSGSRAVGIFTQQDLARAVAHGADLASQRVGDYMIGAPVSIDEEATLAEAGVLLSETGMRHLVVTRSARHRAGGRAQPWI